MKDILFAILFFLIFFLIITSIHYFVFHKFNTMLNLNYNKTILVTSIGITILILISKITYEFMPTFISRFFDLIFSNWIGIFFILFVVLVVFEVFNKFMPIEGIIRFKIIILITLLLVVYAFVNAQLIGVKKLNFTSDKITENKQIVMISDIHIGSRSPLFLNRIVKKIVNLNPDLVIINGDLYDANSVNPDDFKVLNNIKSPIYYITGNHEFYIKKNIKELLGDTNMIILQNRSSILGDLQLIGIDDSRDNHKLDRILSDVKIDNNKYSILLSHQPDEFEVANDNKIDLMLSGHTHNGQIFPFNFLVKLRYKYNIGFYELDYSKLYISAGTGTWGPVMRLGSHNEITLIELDFE